MMLKAILFLFSVSTILVFAKTVPSLKNSHGHEIIDGNCSSTLSDDKVFDDHVKKNGWPYISRTEAVTYYGDVHIYCIEILNQINNETGGTSYIDVGGVGYNFVLIELVSEKGYGLDFNVTIYGKKSSTEAIKSPIAQSLPELN